MPKIFISYRRDDSAGMAGRLYDRLKARFGRKNVIMDIDAIPLGVDFRERLRRDVDQCNVVLAVVGREWFGRTPEGGRRLDDPKDYVRVELETALARGIPVIPVLIDKVSMPAEAELPPSLAGLSYRNAIMVDHGVDFHGHADRLIRGIEQVSSTGDSPAPDSIRRWTWRIGLAVLAAVLMLLATLVVVTWPGSRKAAATPEPLKLVLIPAGEFLMGSPDTDPDASDDEKPQHRVRITRPYYVGIHEVTQRQYRAVTGENPSNFKGSDDLPVENVRWNDAINYCNALSRKEGLIPFYRVQAERVEVPDWNGPGYRLPTEAQWEYACRAGSKTRYSFGDVANLDEYAWYSGDSGDKTHPVGEKRPNAWGLYDMHGNVWEWCWDGFDADLYKSYSVDDTRLDASEASVRVIRGGGWYDGPRPTRSAFRGGGSPVFRLSNLGFRVARGHSGR
jgi:formylglycine-generating enzyme required for sulfatase activity